MNAEKQGRFPYAEHDNGVVLTQPRPGEFERRPMTIAELAAREPALQIAKDIYRHANQAGACYYEIWLLIAKAIDSAARSATKEWKSCVKCITGEACRDGLPCAFGRQDNTAQSASGARFPQDLLDDLVMWTRQVGEQPPERVARGIASSARGLHHRLGEYIGAVVDGAAKREGQ